MAILPGSIDFDEPFPRQTRRLRLGVVGGGRISQTQAMAARMTDRWDIIAGAFSSDPSKAQLRDALLAALPAVNFRVDPHDGGRRGT